MDAIIMQVYILLMVYNTVVFGVLLFGSDTMKNDMTVGSEWTTHNPVWVQDKAWYKTSLRIQLFLHVPYFVVAIVCVIMQKGILRVPTLLYASTILVIVAQEYFELYECSDYPIKSINLLELTFASMLLIRCATSPAK
jgi:hypothetical protein